MLRKWNLIAYIMRPHSYPNLKIAQIQSKRTKNLRLIGLTLLKMRWFENEIHYFLSVTRPKVGSKIFWSEFYVHRPITFIYQIMIYIVFFILACFRIFFLFSGSICLIFGLGVGHKIVLESPYIDLKILFSDLLWNP